MGVGCSFTYRGEDRVVAFGLEGDGLLVAMASKVVEWSRSGRRIVREADVSREVVGVEYVAGRWILLSKDMAGVLVGSQVKDICPKEPLDAAVAYGDVLLLVGGERVVVIAPGKGEGAVRSVRLVSGNGVCTCGVEARGRLLLSFENGKVFLVEQQDVERAIDGGVGEIRIDDARCLAFLKEPVASVGLLGGRLVVSLFSRKILMLDLETLEGMFTEMAYDVRGCVVWKGLIVANDSRNNVIFLDQELRIVYSSGVGEEICGVLADDAGLAVGFEAGVVKEYGDVEEAMRR